MSDKFNENLKKYRIQRGVTQAELATKIGVAKSTYSMYESGSREPSVETIKKIADCLGILPSYLLGWEPISDEEIGEVFYENMQQPITIASRFDGDEYTKEELEQIRQFAEFIKSNRK